jgi:hypothetical protein
MTTTFRRIYVILGVAAIASFFGHAMWAVRGKDKFVELVTGSFDHVLGISVGTSTATNMVKVIGYWDIALSVVMAVAVIGFLQKSGPLHRFALSPLMLGVWVWAIFWGFATGASRMSGAGVWYPEVWDLVERGPNFLVPAALLVMTLFLRRQETLREETLSREALVVPDFADIPHANGSREKEPVA